MIDRLDDDIRDLVRRSADSSPIPAAWDEVLDRSQHEADHPSGKPSPLTPQVIGLVAATFVLVVGGLLLITRPSTTDPAATGGTITLHSAPATTSDVQSDAPSSEVSITTAVAPTTLLPTTSVETAPGAVGETMPLIAIGNFVMLGAAQELTELGFAVDALEDRSFADGVELLELLDADGLLPDTLLLGLADNGPMSETDVAVLLEQTLRSTPRVVFVTTTVDTDWAVANNELIRSLPSQYPNVAVLDWAAALPGCGDECVYEDGFHLRSDGAALYTQLAAALIPSE